MTHRTFGRFWNYYDVLPIDIRELADKNFELLKADPRHPSLHFKKIELRNRTLWAVRVGDGYRAVAYEREKGVISWFWIGSHAEYDRIIK